MHSKINKIIEEWIGQYSRDDLQDLRNKTPQLTEEIVRVVVEEIEKHCPDRYLPSYQSPTEDDYKLNRALRDIINLLKQ